MKGRLLDTGVISKLRRPRPSARVRTFVADCSLDELFVSTVTFAEIRFGIETVSDLTRRADLHDWLLYKVRPMFDQRVLEASGDVMCDTGDFAQTRVSLLNPWASGAP